MPAEPLARGLRPSALQRDEAEPRQADGGPQNRRNRPGHVEGRGGVRAREGTWPRQNLSTQSSRYRVSQPKPRTSGAKGRGEASAKCVVPAVAGDPIARICPLAGPNEAMAYEAQIQAWFAVRHASRLLGAHFGDVNAPIGHRERSGATLVGLMPW